MSYEFRLRNIKYVPKAKLTTFILIFILIILSFLVIWLPSFYFYAILLLYIIIMVISIMLISEDVNIPSDKELKELLKILDNEEVINYIRELISLKSIDNIKYIGIELDLKFNTNLTEKKGWNAGEIRDDWIYKKIEKLYNIIINKLRNK